MTSVVLTRAGKDLLRTALIALDDAYQAPTAADRYGAAPDTATPQVTGDGETGSAAVWPDGSECYLMAKRQRRGRCWLNSAGSDRDGWRVRA